MRIKFISIHHMLWLKDPQTSLKKPAKTYFNTSHVVVKEQIRQGKWFCQANFNTSHVVVKGRINLGVRLPEWNFNTSHVVVKVR